MSDFARARGAGAARARAHHPHGARTAAASSARRSPAPTCSSTSTTACSACRRSGWTIPQRDYLFLSKGHDVPALYGTLAELGFFPTRAAAPTTCRSTITSTGTPTAPSPASSSTPARSATCCPSRMGVAIDVKLRGGPNRVFVVLGDGELDEGSVWEAALVASAKKLDNLVVIVDRNDFQANIGHRGADSARAARPTSWRAFGFAVRGRRRPRLRRAASGPSPTLPAHARQAHRDHRAHRARQGPAQPRGPRRSLVRRPVSHEEVADAAGRAARRRARPS